MNFPPIAGDSFGEGFAAHKHPVGKQLSIQLVPAGGIVVAGHIQHIQVFLGVLGDKFQVHVRLHGVSQLRQGLVDLCAQLSLQPLFDPGHNRQKGV